MNLRKSKIAIAVMCLTAFANFSEAQQGPGTLEMTSTGSSNTTLGPSTTPLVITFRQDSLNATFNTLFKPQVPALTATLSFANQQFTTAYNNMFTGMAFGGGNTASTGGTVQQSATNPIYNAFGASLVQPPQNGMFVSNPAGVRVGSYQSGGRGVGLDVEGTQNGTDIATGSFDYNFGAAIFTTVEPLWDANLPKDGRYYYGDLVINFSAPVEYPVIHIGGLGGSYNYQPIGGGPRLISYFTTELELQPTPGVTSTLMAGNEFFTVSGNKILNSSPTPNGGSYNDGGTQGGFPTYGAATGSVRLNGTFSQIVYKVYVRGSVNSNFNFSQNQAAIVGATRDPFNGDLFYLGVSMRKPCVGAACGPVPLTLTDFSAVKNSCNALLVWKTATESGSDRFEVELSTDNGNVYTKVGTVAAVGNSQSENTYQFSYAMKAGVTNLFRLKLIDKDGSFRYSSVRSLSCTGGKVEIVLNPNPVKDRFFVSGMEEGTNNISILSASGQLVHSTVMPQNQGYVDMSNLSPGIYMVKITSEKGNTTVKKVIKD